MLPVSFGFKKIRLRVRSWRWLFCVYLCGFRYWIRPNVRSMSMLQGGFEP